MFRMGEYDEAGLMEVRNLSYICSTYVDISSPIKPAKTIEDEIEIFFAIMNGPGKENYSYPKDRKVKGDEIALEIKKQANMLFIEKKYAEAVGYYTIASRFGQSSSIVADAIGNRAACYEAMGNNVACWHDCNAAFDYGFGADHEPKSEKMKNRKSKAEKNLGEEGLEKVKKNREFVESYEGVEMFDKELIEVRHDIDKGFHVVAKTDIPKGTIIIEEKAQFYAPLKYESHFPGSTQSLPLVA